MTGIVGGVLLARALGPEGRGTVAALVAWTGIATILADMGVSSSLIFHASREPERGPGLLTNSVVLALGFSLVAWGIASPALLYFVPHSGLSKWLVWAFLSSIPVVLVGGLPGSLALALGLNRMFLVLRSISAGTYFGGVLLAFVLGATSPGPYLLATWSGHAAGAVAAWGPLRPFRRKFQRPSRNGLRQLLGYAIRVQGASIAAQASLRIDLLLISILLPPAQLGLYATSVAVSSAMGPFYAGMSNAMVGRFSSRLNGRDSVASSLRLIGLAMLLGIAPVGLLFAGAPLLIPALFGIAFESAVAPARILLLASPLAGANQMVGTLLRLGGHPTFQLYGEVAGLAITMPMLLVLVPRYGIEAAAWTSVLAYATTLTLELLLLVRVNRSGPRMDELIT